MLRTGAILLLAALAASCTGLPQIETGTVSTNRDRRSDCSAVFPVDRWRFVHAIETVISGNSASVVVGVTVIDPGERAVEAIIMTLEGLVMFHARGSGAAIDIRRAIAPFDSPLFARGLIEDVTLLFLAPVAVKTTTGFSRGGTFTCRYIRDDASVVDVMPAPDGAWEMLEYDRRANLRRRAAADRQGDCPSTQVAHLPCRIELEATRRPAYTLKMSLIEAERITE